MSSATTEQRRAERIGVGAARFLRDEEETAERSVMVRGLSRLVWRKGSVPGVHGLHSGGSTIRRRVEKIGSATNVTLSGLKPGATTQTICRPGASGKA